MEQINKYIYAIGRGMGIDLSSILADSESEAKIRIMEEYGYPADTDWEEFLSQEELFASEIYNIEEF